MFLGVLPHTAASWVSGEALPAGGLPGQPGERVPWPHGRRWGLASGERAAEGRCERGLCRYITFCCEHPQENQQQL